MKKHYGRWMDIVRSLELESCILTKLTKPSVPINLVGPQVSLPLYWVPANRGSIHFLCVIRRHFWWVRADIGGNVFSEWVSRGMARPAMGVRWGSEACAAAQPAAGRREQAVPPALV